MDGDQKVREGLILPLLPPDAETDLSMYGPIMLAQDGRPSGTEEVSLVDDVEAQSVVVEIEGEAPMLRGTAPTISEDLVASTGRLVFHCETHLPILALHVRNMKKSFAVILQVSSNEQTRGTSGCMWQYERGESPAAGVVAACAACYLIFTESFALHSWQPR
jgi:hypothetical protein